MASMFGALSDLDKVREAQRKRFEEQFGGPGGKLFGLGEVAASMATGLGSSVLGGLAALPQLYMGGPDAAAKALSELQQRFTYQPRSMEGRAMMAGVERAGQALDAPFQALGEGVLKTTGSPAAAAMAYATSQALTGGQLGRRAASGMQMEGVNTAGPLSRQRGVIAAGDLSGMVDIPRYPQTKAIQGPNQALLQAPSGVTPGEMVRATHFSHDPDLQAVLAGRYGTRWPGGEANRLAGANADVRPRTFFYNDLPEGAPAPERGVGPYRYDYTLSGMYDMTRDPEALMAKAREKAAARGGDPQEALNIAERDIRRAGYRGVVDKEKGWGYTFEDVDLTGQLDTARAVRELEASRRPPDPEGMETSGQAAKVASALEGEFAKSGQRYLGSGGVRSHQKLNAEQRRLAGMAAAAAPTADWYIRDAQALAQMTSGRGEPARQVASGLAITSPQTSVAGNAIEGVRAYYQNLLGDTIKAGRFPSSMGTDFMQIVNDVAADIGRKRGSFMNNELQYWPEYAQGSTIDMQMKRAFGYKSKGDAVDRLQYDYMERMTKRIADRLNDAKVGDRHWTPSQVQAAIWTAQKMKAEGTAVESAGGNFIDTLQENTASVPYEATPGGMHLGAPRELVPFEPDLKKDPYATAGQLQDVNQLYSQDVLRLMEDSWGNNPVLGEMGLLQLPQGRGMGVWGEQRNPNAVARAVAPQYRGPDADALKVDRHLGRIEMKKNKDTGKMEPVYKSNAGGDRSRRLQEIYIETSPDPSFKKGLRASTAVTGEILQQEAGAWVLPSTKNAPKYAKNYAKVQLDNFEPGDLDSFQQVLGSVLADPKFRKRHPSLYKDNGELDVYFPVVPSPDGSGVQVWKPFAPEGVTGRNALQELDQIKDGQKAIEETVKRLGGKAEWAVGHSELLEAENYASAYGVKEMAERAQRAKDMMSPLIQQHQEWYRRNYPLGDQVQIQDSRPRFGNQGLETYRQRAARAR